MKAKGYELEFLYRILPDGSGTVKTHVRPSQDKCEYRMSRLSISNDTWIASEFHSYIVKWNKMSFQERFAAETGLDVYKTVGDHNNGEKVYTMEYVDWLEEMVDED